MSYRTGKIYGGGSGSGGGSSTVNLKEDTSVGFSGSVIMLANVPTFVIGVFFNGQRLTETADYAIIGNTLTLVVAAASDTITVIYRY